METSRNEGRKTPQQRMEELLHQPIRGRTAIGALLGNALSVNYTKARIISEAVVDTVHNLFGGSHDPIPEVLVEPAEAA